MLEADGHLGGCSVPEVEALKEGQHVGGVGCLSGVDVASFSRVAKEWHVSQRWVGSPMPLARIPWEILDESHFVNPV